MKRRREADDAAPDNPESSRRRDVNTEGRSNEGIGDDPILYSFHKIFLSHSGAQKDFVEQLCQDLEKRYYFPFFDKRPSSLPKGERFPELILNAARQCEMAVIVISEEYFMSKWPMIELNTFVQTRLEVNLKLKILPLFYKLLVDEFHNEKRREQWFGVWEDWAKVDERIKVDEWKKSLKILASFNGIECAGDLRAIEAYRENIVSNICTQVSPEIQWDDSHVQGRSNLCQELRYKFNQIWSLNEGKVCLIGIFGMGGIGKTTICKTLCNELFQEFNGRVRHVEFGYGSFEGLLKEVLRKLLNIDQECLDELDTGQCHGILRKSMRKQKVFLAIDNVWDDSKSIEDARMYLQTDYHKGSVVVVTSRSLKTLTYLGIEKSHCFEMPELEFQDAKDLFIQHAAYGIQFSKYDDICAINKCIALCYFNKGDNKGGHYLPLALKALGTHLGYLGRNPLDWVKALPKVKDFNYLQEEQNPVFSILRSSYDRLRPMDQSLFMDLVVYIPATRDCEMAES
ncbi:hypothetical protein M758_3G181400 [Ceratodon purpureus]|nr:hypothetical protein M758_3G181400 [Ceratodon purpureus]